MPAGFVSQIEVRMSKAGLAIEPAVAETLDLYLQLLAKWNKTINLTALPLEPPTDAAIDRLLIEPLVAARHVDPNDRLAIDVGSGGGSPAIPMKIGAPWLRMILVESRVRKAAFLREVTRTIGLVDADVQNRRLEELATETDFLGTADLITVRAVGLKRELQESIKLLARPGGRVFWFGARPDGGEFNLLGASRSDLIRTSHDSQLLILKLP